MSSGKRLFLEGQNGFTLLEVLVVMAVLTVILSIAVLSFKPLWGNAQKKMFITKLESDLYYAHSYAISRKESVTVAISRASNEYSAAEAGSGKELFRRKLSAFNRITETNISRYTIAPNGNITPFGTVLFSSGGETIKLTLHLGRGRFVVSE